MKTNHNHRGLIISNAKITTLYDPKPEAQALRIQNGRIQAVGENDEILASAHASDKRIDAGGRRVIPGLNDSHLHVIRGGLYYNLELRWDGIPSLEEALYRLKVQADNTPPPQWVRVIGGWNEWQFRERRMPTLDELNRVAPDTPVFVLHLYDSALLNRAAMRALGMDADSPNPAGGLMARDASGRPTGLLIAEPNALILYATLARAPKLSLEDQANASRHFMHELNRFGVTSACDAGGGGQNYPDDYAVIRKLAADGRLTLRMAYSLFAQAPGTEIDDYGRWVEMTSPGDGDDFLRFNGAGENLVWSAADFENFLQPRPDLKPIMESELEGVVRLLVEHRWPFRIHATYDQSIRRFLTVFERINQEVPFNDLRWWFDHAETISPQSIDRVAALGGGVAIQHRVAYQGEYYIRRYGAQTAQTLPPVRRLLEAGLPVGAGTDGTRVASYHPWTCLWWLVTGKTVGGTVLTPAAERLSRLQALTLYTHGSAWFSGEARHKGRLVAGQMADLAILSKDYFSVAEDEIREIESVMTVVDGDIVYAAEPFAAEQPPLPSVSPDWSPAKRWSGYWKRNETEHRINHKEACTYWTHDHHSPVLGADGRLWRTGCNCAII